MRWKRVPGQISVMSKNGAINRRGVSLTERAGLRFEVRSPTRVTKVVRAAIPLFVGAKLVTPCGGPGLHRRGQREPLARKKR
jgi:hypothetical protein